MDNMQVIKDTTITIKKITLALVLSYLASISLKIRNNSKRSLENILNCFKLKIVFKD